MAADFFSYGNREYLAYVDRASGWVSVCCFNKIGVTTKEIIPYIRKFFVEFGIPEKFERDQGPQFSSNEFQTFLNKWGVEWVPSSPHYPQSNGLAESSVKKLKYLIAKIVDSHGSLVIEELDKGILELRNTPAENGLSAAQMVFGQELRSVLPSIRASLLKERKKNYYNQHSKTMPELCINQRVRVQDEETKRWNKVGTIVKIGDHRQYLVEMENGRKLWRNLKFLLLIQQQRTPRDVDRNRELTKFPNPQRRVTFQEDPTEMAADQRMMLRRNRGINYRALAGMT